MATGSHTRRPDRWCSCIIWSPEIAPSFYTSGHPGIPWRPNKHSQIRRTTYGIVPGFFYDLSLRRRLLHMLEVESPRAAIPWRPHKRSQKACRTPSGIAHPDAAEHSVGHVDKRCTLAAAIGRLSL